MSICLSPARAAASRRNGLKSRGPKTPEGKARSAQNALRHGLCAQRFVVLRDEDAQAYAVLEAALLEELAPQGVLQRLLAGQIVRAAWRLERAERIETELLELRKGGDENLALALIRDGNGTRSFDTLLRYRGRALAEFYRALRTLEALQDEVRASAVPAQAVSEMPLPREPNEPDRRSNPGLSTPSRPKQGDAGPALPVTSTTPGPRSTRRAQRNKPESRSAAGLAPPPDDSRRAA